MASWILVPCLVSLRNEFNQLAPNRGKASDGSIGDTSHAASSSDHNADETGNTPTRDADDVNEVHAIDVDKDLRRPDVSMERCVQTIVLRHRAGKDDRLQNVIYNRRIWSRSWGWTARAYTGPNPHDHHAHFSARYTSAQEADTRPWGLLDLMGDAMTKDEFLALLRDRDVRRELATAVLAHDPGLTADGKVPAGGVQNYGPTFKENPTVAPAWSIGRAQVAADLGYQNRAKLDQVIAQLSVLTGRDFTDEQAIAAAVLAGLNPQLIAAAIPPELAGQVADELAARLQG